MRTRDKNRTRGSQNKVDKPVVAGAIWGIVLAVTMTTPAAAATIQYANNVVRQPNAPLSTATAWTVNGGEAQAVDVEIFAQTIKTSTTFPYDTYSVASTNGPGPVVWLDHGNYSSAGSRCYHRPLLGAPANPVAISCWQDRV